MGKININMVKGILVAVVMIIILFTLVNESASEPNEAAGNLTLQLNSSNHCPTGTESDCYAYYTWPLMNFFKKKGILLLGFMAGLVLLLITIFLGKK